MNDDLIKNYSEMISGLFVTGQVIRHFKGGFYSILTLAKTQ